MRRIFFLLVAAAFIVLTACDAQKKEINSISSELKRGNVIEAKNRIDSAIEGEVGQNPSAWIVRSNIYMEIFISEDPEVKAIHQDPLGVAYESLEKAKEFDVNNQNILLLQQNKLMLSQYFHEAGAISFNEGRFPLASAFFRRSYDVSKSLNVTDTLTLFYAAYAADRGMIYPEAKQYLNELIDLGYHDLTVYTSLINVSAALEEHDEAKAWIQKAKDLNPDDVDITIIFAEANYYLKTGDTEGAKSAISAAIEKEPNNANLHFALGANYERIFNDKTHSEKDRKDAFDDAINAYKRSLEIDDNQFEVIYSLGALYFNRGIALFEEGQQVLRDCEAKKDWHCAEYNEKEKEFKKMWLSAQPFLEHSKEIVDTDNPNFKIVINSLTELYARTNQNDKLMEIMELRKRLGFDTVE
jgi:tetratricopeptide (TPR) repeat protein